MAEPDLSFIARQLERVLTEVGGLRDEVRVQGAMILRLDGTITALLEEFRATHAQITRMNDRIRKLEDAP
jgi:hypothetical protein